MATEYHFGNDDFDTLMQMARTALDRGYDPEKIYAIVQAGAQENGMSWDKDQVASVLPLTSGDPVRDSMIQEQRDNRMTPKRALKNLLTPDVVEESNAVRNSPNAVYATGAYDPKAPEAKPDEDPGFFGNVGDALATNFAKAAQTAQLAGGGLLDKLWYVPHSFKDKMWEQAAKRAEDNQWMPEGKGAGGFVGNLLGGAATLGIGSLSEGQDILDRGGDLKSAELATWINAAANEVGLLTGKLGNGIASRVLTQAAAGGALGEASRVAKNAYVYPEDQKQDFSLSNLATNIGAGAAGGLFPNKESTKAPKEPILKTADVDVNAGIKAFEKLSTEGYDNDFINEFGSTKNFGPAAELGDFTKPSTSNLGSVIEADITVSPFSNKTAEENAAWAQHKGEVPPVEETGVGLQSPELTALRDQLRADRNVQEAPATAQFPEQNYDNFASGTKVDVSFNDPEFTPAFKRKASSSLPSEPTPGTRPTRTIGYKLGEDGVPVPVKSGPKPRSPGATRDALLAELRVIKNRDSEIKSPAAEQTSFSPEAEQVMQDKALKNRLSLDVYDRFRKGTLTSNHVLDSIADNHENLFDDTPHTQALAGMLRDAAKRLGQSDVPISKYSKQDAPVGSREARLNATSVKGHYNPQANAIFMNDHVPNVQHMLHEIGHSLTTNAMYKGAEGKLPLEQQKAYTRLHTMFDSLREHLDEGRTPDPSSNTRYASGESRHYGLTNLDEFTAEFWSNDKFRDTLKNVKMSELGLGGMARLAKGAINNAYQAVTNGFRKLLGMPDKADNSFDAMFTASKDFLDKLTPDDRQFPEGATMAAFEEGNDVSGLRKATGGARNKVRALFGGQLPEIKAAREQMKGEASLGGIKADQFLNSVNRVMNKKNEAEITQHVDTVLKDVRGPEASKSIEALKKIDKNMGAHVERFARSAPNERLRYAESILSMPGDIPDHMLDLAGAIIKKADTYQHKFYDINQSPKSIKAFGATLIPGYGENIKANAAAGEKAIAAGQEPTRQQKVALDRINGVKQYFNDFFLVSPERAEKLSYQNLEQAYKFHTGKELSEVEPLSKYKDEDNTKAARKQAAVQLLKEKAVNVHDKNEALNQLVDKALSLTNDEADNTIKFFRNLRMPSNVFATLKDVPKPLQELWGVDHSPIATMAATMTETARINATLKAMSGLHQAGMGKLFTDQLGVKGYTETLSGEKMGVLQGLHTTPEVKDMIDSFIQGGSFMGTWNKVLYGDQAAMATLGKSGYLGAQALRKIAGFRKATTILGNPAARMAINAVGSGFQMISNGNFNLVSVGHGLLAMKELIGAGSKNGLSELAQDAIKYHMAESSTLAEGYGPSTRQALAKFLNTEGAADPGTVQAKLASHIREIASNGGEALTTAKELYGAMDLWSKIANYHNELEFWKKQYGDKKPLEDIKAEVANRINDTNITPSRAWTIAKITDAAGLTVFAPYYAEVARTTINNLGVGRKDLMQGLKEGNAALISHGAKRLIGTGVSVGASGKLLGIATKAVAVSVGLAASQIKDDDARKEYLDSIDQFKGGEPVLFKDDNGNEFVVDASMANPYDPLTRPLLAGVSALNGDGKAAKHVDDAVKMIAGMFNKSSIWAYGEKEITGGAPTWARMNPQAYESAQQWIHDSVGNLDVKDMNRLLNLATFGSPQLAEKIIRAGGLPEGGAQKAAKMGFPVNELNPTKELANIKSFVTAKTIDDARHKYVDLLKANIDADPEKIESKFKSGLKDVATAYQDVSKAVSAAKAQGKSNEDIAKAFALGNMPREVRMAMLGGKSIPAYSMIAKLRTDAISDYLRANSNEGQKEATDRFSKNSKLIQSLFNKYKDKSVEEIINGE